MSSRIAGNDRLGLGSSKIEVLAKKSKKKLGKSMIFLVFPACGVGILTSFQKPVLGTSFDLADPCTPIVSSINLFPTEFATTN